MAEFPIYILDRPKGTGEFEGKSQSNMSKVIAEYITSNDIPNEDEASKSLAHEGYYLYKIISMDRIENDF